jgi:hypothetical protein
VNHVALEQLEERAAGTGPELDPMALVGNWVNTNASPALMRRIQLVPAKNQRQNQLMMRVAGTEPGLPEDWGEGEAQLFAESPTQSAAMAFSAAFDLHGVKSLLQGYVVKGVLVIVSFTRVTDGRERSSSFGKEFFYRVS